LLLGRLYSLADDECYVYPGVERLAEEFGVDRSTIKRWLWELSEAGYIARKRRGPGRSSGSALLWHKSLVGSLRSKANVSAPSDDLDGSEVSHQTDDGSEVSHQDRKSVV